jgi:hypothetical protein
MRCRRSSRSRSGFGSSTPKQKSVIGGFLEIPHASARTGIFADGGRVFVSETAANFMEVRSHKINLRLDLESRRKPIGFCPAKSQQPTYAFVLPRWSKGNNAAVLSNCVFGAVHLMHHT